MYGKNDNLGPEAGKTQISNFKMKINRYLQQSFLGLIWSKKVREGFGLYGPNGP